MSENKRTFWQSLKAHETTLVEIAAVLTSAPRWILTLVPVDKASIDTIIKSGNWWDWASAVLSVAFAVVEIWATAMIMRSFVLATRNRDKVVLFAAWLLSLVVLALMQIPPLYAGLMSTGVANLSQPWPVVYVVAVSIAAFVVIAGVSYSDRVRVSSNRTAITDKVPVVADKDTSRYVSHKDISGYTLVNPVEVFPMNNVATETTEPTIKNTPVEVVKSKPFSSYGEFREYAEHQNGAFPKDVTGIARNLKNMGQPYQTALKWAKKLVAEKSKV